MNIQEIEQQYYDDSKVKHKAGLLPYLRTKDGLKLLFCLSSNPAFGGDRFMISKGGVDPGETPRDAAIREAVEEMGLVQSNLAGPVQTGWSGILRSDVTSNQYQLSIFIVEVKDPNNFGPHDYEIAERRWMTPEEFYKVGRREHVPIVKTCVEKISEPISESKPINGVFRNINERGLARYLQKNCSLALKTYRETGEVLYRVSRENTPIFINTSPTNRRPVDTPADVQGLVDNYLAQMGFRALRHNSIFCSPDFFSVQFYRGLTYVVFPIDGFDFTYSEVLSDFTEEITGPDDIYTSNTWGKVRDLLRSYTPEEFVDEYRFRHDSFQQAMKSGNEVYIHGTYLSVARRAPALENILGFKAGPADLIG